MPDPSHTASSPVLIHPLRAWREGQRMWCYHARDYRPMTVIHAARKAGLSQGAWSRYENFQRRPDLNSSLAIERFTKGAITPQMLNAAWEAHHSRLPVAA